MYFKKENKFGFIHEDLQQIWVLQWARWKQNHLQLTVVSFMRKPLGPTSSKQFPENYFDFLIFFLLEMWKNIFTIGAWSRAILPAFASINFSAIYFIDFGATSRICSQKSTTSSYKSTCNHTTIPTKTDARVLFLNTILVTNQFVITVLPEIELLSLLSYLCTMQGKPKMIKM